MAGLKCSHCGGSIRYHGTPNGIEHTVFSVENWEKLISTVYDPNNVRIHEEWSVPGPYLYRADTIWEDFKDDYIEVWICPHCGTIAVFDNSGVHVKAVYIPINDTVEVDNKAEKYFVFSDYIWNEITDLSIPTKDIPKKFTPTYMAVANDKHLWVFDPTSHENLLKTYERMNE